MLDSFLTNANIVLQPGSSKVPYSFTFAAASSATANDGSIPFGSTIASVVVKAFDSDGVDKTSEIIEGTPTSTSLVVSVDLNYPAITGNGTYSLEFLLTLSTGAVLEVDYNRVIAKDITV